ncbi:general transcription factor IIH subunit 2 [Chelonus insularis]|uniref:general transcription factor IIH subunit 2 n=1 Tax=Chelonus insularis TaxID=460826 RepID=UPI001589A525|nr:general transcription factor IIH subunit 2 [Chelonus insularis]
MAEEENLKEYRWETGYEKTWEAIKEDDHGSFEASVADIIHKAKRKRQLEKTGGARLGMMRHLYIILDVSESITSQDLKPTRLFCTVKLLEEFIDEFFYQNPISQLGIIVTKNKRAEKLSELSGNAKKHIKEVKSLLNSTSLTGEPSLQNSLELALKSLKNLPSHASREILVIMASLTTCDPGDIYDTIQTLKSESVRCSVIGLSAELHVCKKMATLTGGEHAVVLDDKHYRNQLKIHVDPPPAATRLDAALVKMGFPHHALSSRADISMSLCMCHADSTDDFTKLSSNGYLCPQCLSKHCELPVECKSCGLTLVSAPHLARSYHYLFPVNHFKEMPHDNSVKSFCYGCQKSFSDMDKKVYVCEKCTQTFCIDCEIFIHESLHTCPGCATSTASFHKPMENSNT